MNALEQSIWANVYAAWIVKEAIAKNKTSVREAIVAADYAVYELQKEQEKILAEQLRAGLEAGAPPPEQRDPTNMPPKKAAKR